MNIIQDTSAGGNIGSAFGTGISQGLQALLNNKLTQVQQHQNALKSAQGLQALGIPQYEASQIASLPEALQGLVIKQKLQEPGNQAYMQALQQILNPDQQNNSPASTSNRNEATLQSLGISNDQLGLPKNKQIAGGINQQQATKLAELSLKQKSLAAKEKLEQQKQQIKEQHRIDTETKPFYDEINKEYKSVKPNNLRLDRIEKLTKEGNLGWPIANSALESLSKGIFGFGINLKHLMTKDAQELEKLSNDFVKSAKDIFGSRITDNDLKVFLQSIPSLYQSNEGRLSVINNLRMFNEAAEIKKHAMDKIIADNNGKRPYNLDILVDKATQQPLDELSKRFIAGTPKENTSLFKSLAQGVGLSY